MGQWIRWAGLMAAIGMTACAAEAIEPEPVDATATATEPQGQEVPHEDPCAHDNGGCGDAAHWTCESLDLGLVACHDVDECEVLHGGCDPLVECENLEGAPALCGPCPEGYIGNGYTGCVERIVCEGDAIVETEADLASYRSCHVITGDLSVLSTDIAAIELPSLEIIEGSLFVSANTELQSLAGLSNLDTVGVHIKITDNPVLHNLDGLDDITEVPGELYVMSNPSLVHIEGLSKLTHVLGRLLKVGSNAMLEDLEGLRSLQYVGGALSIWGNPQITSLMGLDSLASIGTGEHEAKNLEVNFNASLISLDALSALHTIPGDLQVAGNAILPSLEGLHNLTSVGGGFVVINNPALPSCEVDALLERIASEGGIAGGIQDDGNSGDESCDDLGAVE